MSISEEDKEHLVKHELFMHFSEFQKSVEKAPVGHVFDWLASKLFPRSPPIIDTSNYFPQKADSFSESQMIDRTTFAMRKIHEFNPHFFTMLEARAIEPSKLGVLSHLGNLGFVGVEASVIVFMWKSWTFNPKIFALLGGIALTQNLVLRSSAFVKEQYHHYFRRRPLAEKYLEAYGKEFMNDIVSPSYNCEHLKHMPNKLRK